MPSRGRDIRWRYIAFRIEAECCLPRSDFLGALLKAARQTNLQDSFRITVYEGDFGILKVPHRFRDDAVEVLNSLQDVKGMPAKVTTLKTSGTIKTLKDKYAKFIRAEEGRPE